MKKILRKIALFLVFVPIIGFSQNQKLNASDLGTGPKISWEKENFNFGEIKQNVPVDVRYTFKNTGNAPLIIQNVQPSCGCTNADYTRTPVLPGQKGFVKVIYDSKAMGNFTKSVTVTTNEAESGVTILKFEGTVIQ